ncbi:type I-E CRISPR-associated endoribonuclease Cas2e [Candidatus Viridilinea mediisalina]|uniref:Type I-E CRISPR-associated endoribonuclease Cas2 n=1 Tax=Candidatus Viridilinea mediisalina TaxID=2024553 RepID=A0A2A6REZ3_9CHLR|nr:type I-E CRISPR-associated endoribonuclease Cas2e [Candidatus Viridilinea mediisalina]PDW01456.1 type I-E CRISPR-associated endoribonuclease Cas2 [Candidatus Viridilinea mediisalina]
MTVIVLERVPASVRGELSRWMLEIHTGVFVGSLSAKVRDLVWQQICEQMSDGAGFLVYQTNNEQGFAIRSRGTTNRKVIEVEGLFLVRIPS